MTFTRSKAHVRRVKHPRYKWLVTFRSEGKLRKRYFNRRDDADTFADTWQGEAEATGTEHRIDSDERSAILELREEQERVGLTVRAALEMAIERQQNLVRSASVATLIKEHVAAKRQARRSERHRDIVKLLRAGQSIRHVAAITNKGTSTVMRIKAMMEATA